MKKLILVFSPLLVAGVAFANVESVSLMKGVETSSIAVIYKTGTYDNNTLSGWNPTTDAYTAVSNTHVKSLFDGSISWLAPSGKITQSGWWVGTGTSTQAQGFQNDAELSVSADGVASLKTKTRPAYKSEYVAFAYNIADLSSSLSGSYTGADTMNLSLSYSAAGASAAQITLWYIDSQNNVSQLGKGGIGTSQKISGDISYAESGMILALFSNSDKTTETSYSSISLIATIPEPSMFGVLAGLGALALAGTRRRRKE